MPNVRIELTFEVSLIESYAFLSAMSDSLNGESELIYWDSVDSIGRFRMQISTSVSSES